MEILALVTLFAIFALSLSSVVFSRHPKDVIEVIKLLMRLLRR